MKTRLESLLSILFGGIFSVLVIVVTIETIARKLFNISLQGADELGEQYAEDNNIPIKRFPADWKKHGKSPVLRNL